VHVEECWYSIVCMYRTAGTAMCACTGLLIQHCVYVQDCWYSTVCMYRTAGTAFIDCDYNKQQPYTVYCWCWPNVYRCIYNIMLTVNSTYCYTVRYQNNKPTPHLTHFTTTNNNCTTFICTEQHWKVILTVTYCLQSADSQHSHCCCWPTNTLTAVHYTNNTTFVSPSAEIKFFVLLLHWTLDTSKIFCFN